MKKISLYFASLFILSVVMFVPPVTAFDYTCDFVVGASQTYTTIQAGVNAAIASGPSGKTVCVMDNKEYFEVVTIQNVVGTQQAPFRIVGHPNNVNKPVIKRTTPNDHPTGNTGAIRIISSRYVFLQNINVGYSTIIGINVDKSQNIHLTDIVIENTWQSAMRFLDTKNSILENCLIRNAVLYAKPSNYTGGFWGQASGTNVDTPTLKAANGVYRTDNTFRNCEITNSWGEQMSSLRGTGDIFENNYIHHSKEVGTNPNVQIEITSLYSDHSRETVFRNNYILDMADNISVHDEGDYSGFYPGIPSGHTRTIENNLVVGPAFTSVRPWGFGIQFYACEAGVNECIARDDTVRNNTVINTLEGGMFIRSGYQSFTNVKFENNVVVPLPNTNSLNVTGNYPGLTFSGNIYSVNPVGGVGLGGGGQVIDRNNIFSSANALNTNLYSQDLAPSTFALKASLAGKGADVSKVGLLRKTDYTMYKGDTGNTPTPTTPASTPTPTTPQSTPTHTPGPTRTPTPVPCPSFSSGNATCDSAGTIDLTDFTCWKGEFLTGTAPQGCSGGADFDSSGGVDILDFAIWQVGFARG